MVDFCSIDLWYIWGVGVLLIYQHMHLWCMHTSLLVKCKWPNHFCQKSEWVRNHSDWSILIYRPGSQVLYWVSIFTKKYLVGITHRVVTSVLVNSHCKPMLHLLADGCVPKVAGNGVTCLPSIIPKSCPFRILSSFINNQPCLKSKSGQLCSSSRSI